MAMGSEELGRLIRQAREDARMNQRQLADAIGLADAQSISNYERGITEVPSKRLRRIAEVTNKDLTYFLGEPPVEASPPGGTIEAVLQLLQERLPEPLVASANGAEPIRPGEGLPELVRRLEGAGEVLRQEVTRLETLLAQQQALLPRQQPEQHEQPRPE